MSAVREVHLKLRTDDREALKGHDVHVVGKARVPVAHQRAQERWPGARRGDIAVLAPAGCRDRRSPTIRKSRQRIGNTVVRRAGAASFGSCFPTFLPAADLAVSEKIAGSAD